MILDRYKLTDHVAIVTGAGRGIGRAISIAFAEAGADVALAARRADTLDEVKEEIEARGRRALCVPTDVNDSAQLDRLIDRTVETFGRLDVVVNNAGGTAPTVALMVEDTEFNAAFPLQCDSAPAPVTPRRSPFGEDSGLNPKRF